MTEQVVHVIDDDEAMRRSLAFLLASAGLRAQVYDSALAFLNGLDAAAPGCVITDVRMPEMNGLELARRLKAAKAPHPVIVITGHGDVPLAVEAMKAGVVDFLEKPFDDEILLTSVRNALSATPEVAAGQEDRKRFEAMIATLSPRELDVLRGVLGGHQNKMIAHDLGISPRTVEVYRANVMTKTGASNLSELLRMALLAGF